MYQTGKSNISEHIKHIFEDGELTEDSVVRKFRTTAADGKVYNTTHYNLDMFISLGYRVKSIIATNFRRWATERLKEYMIKGFTMDDERRSNWAAEIIGMSCWIASEIFVSLKKYCIGRCLTCMPQASQEDSNEANVNNSFQLHINPHSDNRKHQLRHVM